MSQYIRRMELKRNEIASFSEFPFCLPVIYRLQKLAFHPNVTFIIGENGTGKSTLLEAIAISYGFNPEGGTKNFKFSLKDTHSYLYQHIRLVKSGERAQTEFFLRAETMYNVATYIDELDKGFGCSPKIIDSYGGKSLHKQSHGESFFAVLMNKFSEKGLYILDEPEAALSPSRQMSMIVRMNELVNQGCQFIIATHSPILLAYPNAIIYEITESIKETKYEETEHYQVTKSFLNNTERMLDLLMNEE